MYSYVVQFRTGHKSQHNIQLINVHIVVNTWNRRFPSGGSAYGTFVNEL